MHPEYLNIEQSYFEWERWGAGYSWDEVATSDKGYPGPFLVKNPGAERRSYHPLETEPALFLRFAELEYGLDRIAAFADEFGPLTSGFPITATPRPMPDGSTTFMALEGENRLFWMTEIASMSSAVELWHALTDADSSRLSAIISWDEDGSTVSYSLGGSSGVIAGRESHPDVFSHLTPGDLVVPARLLLLKHVNGKLVNHASPRLLLSPSNELTPYLVPKDLLSAMWLQLFQAAVGERAFKRCAECGGWAEVTGKTERWNVHPRCANRARVRRSRIPKTAPATESDTQ